MRRTGWFGDSYRHMLSAKGIKTKRTVKKIKRPIHKSAFSRYFGKKQEVVITEKKSIMDKLTEQPEGQMMLKQEQERRVINDAREKVMDAVDAGNITSGTANEIMRDVDDEAKFFRTSTSGSLDYEMFKERVERIVEHGIGRGQQKFVAFDWSSKKK